MTSDPSNRVWSNLAIPSGEFLSEELDARGLDITSTALALGLPGRRLKEILAGRKPLTAEIALGLEQLHGVDAQFWMNLQVDYELTLARIARNTPS